MSRHFFMSFEKSGRFSASRVWRCNLLIHFWVWNRSSRLSLRATLRPLGWRTLWPDGRRNQNRRTILKSSNMTKHPKMTHSSSFLGCIKPIGLRFFKVAFCDLEACSSARAVLRASSCARVLSLMSFWSARISSISGWTNRVYLCGIIFARTLPNFPSLGIFFSQGGNIWFPAWE